MLLQDTVDGADATTYLIRKSLVLADAMLATGLADGKLTAYAACAVAIALEDQAKAGWALNAVDQAALVDDVQNKLTAILALAERVLGRLPPDALDLDATGHLALEQRARLSATCAPTTAGPAVAR